MKRGNNNLVISLVSRFFIIYNLNKLCKIKDLSSINCRLKWFIMYIIVL